MAMHYAGGVAAGAGPILEAQKITKAYRRGVWPARHRLEVLSGADLTLSRGELVGLVGENGSGKTTLLRIIVGALAPDAGVVLRGGKLGYCPQLPVLYGRLTCDEHVKLFGSAYGLDPVSASAAAEVFYDRLGYAHWRGIRADALSGGTRAKLNLTLALLSTPDLVVLDEPYSGFDWETYQQFWDLVEELRDAGGSVLVVSHFLADREKFDRIVDLRDGKTSDGKTSDGETSDGEMSAAKRPDGERPDGERSNGETAGNERSGSETPGSG